MVELTADLVDNYTLKMATAIIAKAQSSSKRGNRIRLSGIPRGGVSVAYAVQRWLSTIDAKIDSYVAVSGQPDVYPANEFIALLDDVLATGETIKRHRDGDDFVGVLIAKGAGPFSVWFAATLPIDTWVQFPWEINDNDGGRPEDAVRRLIEYVGDNPLRPGVQDTPRRVLAFLDELRERANGEWHPTTFETMVDDLVTIRNIPLFSLCEHHMLPYYGVAHVGYLPSTHEPKSLIATPNRILGLSKVARVVAQVSSGLTVQEELSAHIATKIHEYANTDDVAVVTRAVHTCMIMRGVRAVGSDTVASCMLGKFKTEPALRAEFMSIVKGV